MLRRAFLHLTASLPIGIFAGVQVFPTEEQRADARQVALQYGISEADALRYLRAAKDMCEAWGLEGAEARRTALDLMHTSARLSRAFGVTPDEAISRMRAKS